MPGFSTGYQKGASGISCTGNYMNYMNRDGANPVTAFADIKTIGSPLNLAEALNAIFRRNDQIIVIFVAAMRLFLDN
jgi:hypothetical protein